MRRRSSTSSKSASFSFCQFLLDDGDATRTEPSLRAIFAIFAEIPELKRTVAFPFFVPGVLFLLSIVSFALFVLLLSSATIIVKCEDEDEDELGALDDAAVGLARLLHLT